MKRIACVCALVAVASLAIAEDTPEEIVVTADPLSGIDGHLARPATVLSAKELRSKDARSIGETVANSLGVSAADFGPSVGRPVIRGLGGSRVRVLEDGIGTMDVSTISADHAVAAEPVFAQQVEIFRGPATLLYGSGASGGLVNLVDERIPARMPDGVDGELYGHYDSVADGWQGAGAITFGLGMAAIHLDGMRRRTGDYAIPGYNELIPDADAVAGTLANSDTDSEQVAGGVSLIGERGFFGVALSGMDNNYGIPGEEGVRIDQAQTRVDLKGAIDDPLPGLRSVRARWGFNDHRHLELEGGNVIGTRLDNEEWEGRIELVHGRLGPWNGVVGAQLQSRDFDSSGEEAFVPPARQDSFALFVFEKTDFRSLHVDAGLRYEHVDSEAPGLNVDAGVYSLSGSVAWEYAEVFELGASLTRAERAPSLEELFSAGPHLASNTFEIGDAALARERSTNVDLFWRKTEGRFTFAVNAFFNAIDRFVFQQESDRNHDGIADRVAPDFLATGVITAGEDDLLLVHHVQRDARFHGIEAEARTTIIEGPRGTLVARVWGDYVRGKLDGGANLPRITPMRLGLDVDLARERFDLGVELLRVFRQDDIAPVETETEGYTMLNVHIGYALPRGEAEMRVFLRGANLLDRDARRHTSFLKSSAPLPGRSILAGVRLSF